MFLKIELDGAGLKLLKSIPDGVTSPQSDPLRDRSVLLLGSCELLLRAEGLVALLNVSSASIFQNHLLSPHPVILEVRANRRSFIPVHGI